MSQKSYFADSWNSLDFAIVNLSLVSLIAGSDIPGYRVLRSMKAIRPLRLLRRIEGMRVVVNCLIDIMPDVSYAVLIYFIFMLIFAIFYVSYFKGQGRGCTGKIFFNAVRVEPSFRSLLQNPVRFQDMASYQQAWFGPNSSIATFNETACSGWPYNSCCPRLGVGAGTQGDDTIGVENSNSSTPTSKQLCECIGGRWETNYNPNVPVQYDNVPQAIVSLFQLSTFCSTVDAMWATVDQNGIHMEPIRNNQPFWILYWILFDMICGFTCINVFIGVVCNSFNRMKEMNEGTYFLTDKQKEWVKTQSIIQVLKPNKARHVHHHADFQQVCGMDRQEIEKNSYIELFFLCPIVIHSIAIACSHLGQSEQFTHALDVINIFCIVASFIEVAFLMWIKTPNKYFSKAQRVLDFCCIMVSNFCSIHDFICGTRTLYTVAQTFRFLRFERLILYLVFHVERLRPFYYIAKSGFRAFHGIGNVISVIFLIIFIFSTMGMQLFGKIAFHNSYGLEANFRSFYRSWLLLIRVGTLDNWNSFMYDAAHKTKECVPDPDYDPRYCGFSDHPNCIPLNGCGDVAIFPFLLIFVLLVGFVAFNLFVSIVLQGRDYPS